MDRIIMIGEIVSLILGAGMGWILCKLMDRYYRVSEDDYKEIPDYRMEIDDARFFEENVKLFERVDEQRKEGD